MVRTAYTVPVKFCGMATEPFCTGAKIVERPVKNAMYVLSVEELAAVTVADAPGVALAMVRAGKALTGRAGLEDGQEVMKGAARV